MSLLLLLVLLLLLLLLAQVAPDYNGMAELYLLMGMHLLVVEFRGYGWSSDVPTRASTFLTDAQPLVENGELDGALKASGIDPRGLPGGSPITAHHRPSPPTGTRNVCGAEIMIACCSRERSR